MKKVAVLSQTMTSLFCMKNVYCNVLNKFRVLSMRNMIEHEDNDYRANGLDTILGASIITEVAQHCHLEER